MLRLYKPEPWKLCTWIEEGSNLRPRNSRDPVEMFRLVNYNKDNTHHGPVCMLVKTQHGYRVHKSNTRPLLGTHECPKTEAAVMRLVHKLIKQGRLSL